MRRLLILLLLVPCLGFSQTKNVVSVTRLFPKTDKVAELEKAIAAHAQKYHMGDWKWRVYQIQTGPDAFGYHIVEGPNSWTDFDGRGNLGAEHTADVQKNLAPLTMGPGSESYSVFRDDLSSVQPTDYADKISITHVFQKPGWGGKIESNLKKAKKVWEKSGESVAVYQSHYSGQGQYTLVTRHKQGWKEKEKGFLKPFTDRYNEMYGENTYDDYLESIQKYTDHAWGEMLTFRADLSSK